MRKSSLFILSLLLLASSIFSQNIIIRNNGCKSFDAAGKCTSCSDRFYQDLNNICQPVNPNCNAYDPANGNCLTCYVGYGLIQGTCLPGIISAASDPNCNTFVDNVCTKCSFGYYFGANKVCKQANVNCKTFNQSNGYCTSCFPSFTLINGNCSLQPQKVSDPNCNTFDSNGVCTKCSTGYYFLNLICTQIDPSCQNFDINKGKCIGCYSGYQLDSTYKCVKQTNQTNTNPYCSSWNGTICLKCAIGSIFNSQGICAVLDPTCKTNNMQTGACIDCYSGYALANNGSCLISTIQNISDPNCNNFNSNGVCTKCSSGYYFNNLNICTKIDDNCQNFNIATLTCLGCYSGYALNIFNQCVKSVENVSDPNCAQWNGTICTKCSFGAIFNSIGVCQVIDPSCKSFNSANGICLQCYSGYSLNSSNACVKSADPVITNVYCAQFNGTICLKCAVGSHFNSQGQCILYDSTCNTSNLISGLCTSCYPGYSLTTSGSCVISQVKNSTNPLCASWQGDLCLSCAKGSFFNNVGICQTVSPLCKTFNSVNGACTSCFAGYQIQGNNCIVSNATQGDPYCKTFDSNGVCKECANRYYMNLGVCTLISVFCNQYNSATGVCLSCYSGFKISGNQCIQDNSTTDQNCASWNGSICLQCAFGSYFDSSRVCQIVDPLCATFNNTNGFCLSCYSSYVLSNGKCLKDTNNTVNDPFCANFQNGICISCSKGYYFYTDGKCTAVSPLCKTYDSINGNCLSCFTGYSLSGYICIPSNDTSKDLNCQSFENNTCIKCSTGYFFNNNRICTLANPLCKTWNPLNGYCLTCYNGYIISGVSCIVNLNFTNSDPNCAQYSDSICVKCASRSFMNLSGLCQSVNVNCNTYNDFDGSCLTCYQGFSLNTLGQCVQSAVGNGCSAFDSNGKCTKCGSGYYLQNGGCNQIDPQCANFDTNSLQCVGCYSGYTILNGVCQVSKVETQYQVKNCFAYNLNNLCISCYDRYFLSNNSCNGVNVFCKTYDHANGDCLSCYTTFTLNKGKCTQ